MPTEVGDTEIGLTSEHFARVLPYAWFMVELGVHLQDAHVLPSAIAALRIADFSRRGKGVYEFFKTHDPHGASAGT